MKKEKEPTGRFHMIAVDVMEYFTIDEQDKDLVTGIFEVYIFDNETNHHYCSPEKMRYGKFLHRSVHLVDTATEEDYERCDNTYIYDCVTAEDDYFTLSHIERIRKDHPERYKVILDSEWADDMFVSEFFDSNDQPTERAWDFFYEYTREDSWI